MFGIAVFAKALALLWLGAALAVVLAVSRWDDEARVRKWWRPLALVSAGVMLPALAFELWKVAALGFHGYAARREGGGRLQLERRLSTIEPYRRFGRCFQLSFLARVPASQ